MNTETPKNDRDYIVRRAIVAATAVVSFLSVLYELFVSGAPLGEAVIMAILPALLTVVALWEYFHEMRTEILLLFIIGAYGFAGVLDAVLGTSLSSFEPSTTLTVLLLVSVIYVATREKQTLVPVAILATWVAALSAATVVVTDMDTSEVIGFLILGIPGQALALWIIYRLIKSLGEASTIDAKHAQIQRALAWCSHALLKRGSENPLESALAALLDATDADYAYIDVNRVDSKGINTWEIIAEAASADNPTFAGEFNSGDYRHMEFVEEQLLQGLPVQLVTKELPEPIRKRYEKEEIKAELMAPIRIGDRWLGTIGYSDHVQERDWTDIEVDGLMRAAEMVGAYWEREAAREGLMELAQAKDRFIATVSHELRTPLTAVVGFAAELLRGVEGMPPAEVRELATVIHDQSVEVSQLVDDLLTAERAASGNLTVKPGAIPLLRECLDLVASTTVGHDVEVVGNETIAWADSLRTRQIIRNLLTNAVRHGGDSIVVEVETRDERSCVAVRDDGPGVTGIDEERIFDPYYRAQEGLTMPDSVGLGLAVSRQLAGLMDGDIVYRRSDGWTSFELTLPIANGARSGE